MKCSRCLVCKLSQEFPTEISASCDHAPSVCLRCVGTFLASLTTSGIPRCPECGVSINDDRHSKIKGCLASLGCGALSDLALSEKCPDTDCNPKTTGMVTIAMMNGSAIQIEVTNNMLLKEVSEAISQESGVTPLRQLLKYKGRTIEDKLGIRQKWCDLNIPFGSILHLVVLMYTVQGSSRVHGNDLEFRLNWEVTRLSGKTKHGRPRIAQLQGFCTALDKHGKETSIVHFDCRTDESCALRHSGSSGYENPLQKITVYLPDVPQFVSYLFFGVCCRQGLDYIINPSISLLDGGSRILAEYTPCLQQSAISASTNNGGAVVLCCAVRTFEDNWRVMQCGRCCSGYIVSRCKQVDTWLFEPISKEIQQCIDDFLR